ncbi:MAG: VOC family protein [Solimonas sp.]
MNIQAYLAFDGRCEEALEFYREAIGAEITSLMRFSECPDPMPPDMLPPGSEHKIMHSAFRVAGQELLASDGNCAGKSKFDGFSLALSVADPQTAQRYFKALGHGGQIHQPLIKTFFASSFGVVNDRFGVSWMVLSMP